MSIPSRLHAYLLEHGTYCDVTSHRPSRSSVQVARTAHVSAHQIAKAVVLEDDEGCVLALLPADRMVHMGKLAGLLERPRLHLADEERIAALFPDCERGAVPGVGMAWDVETVVDEALEGADTIYLECGDLERLLRMSHDQFRELMHAVPHGRFSAPMLH